MAWVGHRDFVSIQDHKQPKAPPGRNTRALPPPRRTAPPAGRPGLACARRPGRRRGKGDHRAPRGLARDNPSRWPRSLPLFSGGFPAPHTSSGFWPRGSLSPLPQGPLCWVGCEFVFPRSCSGACYPGGVAAQPGSRPSLPRSLWSWELARWRVTRDSSEAGWSQTRLVVDSTGTHTQLPGLAPGLEILLGAVSSCLP